MGLVAKTDQSAQSVRDDKTWFRVSKGRRYVYDETKREQMTDLSEMRRAGKGCYSCCGHGLGLSENGVWGEVGGKVMLV